jgi:hypothetical protein
MEDKILGRQGSSSPALRVPATIRRWHGKGRPSLFTKMSDRVDGPVDEVLDLAASP